MKPTPDIMDFAKEIGSELTRLTHPDSEPRPNMTTANRGGLPFLEQPTANYAGSDVVGLEVPQTDFIPIPNDLREMVEAQMREEQVQLNSPRKLPAPNIKSAVISNVPVVSIIPEGFDFDLFQFAVLKDISSNIKKSTDEFKLCIEKLEQHRKIIETAIGNHPLSRKN